MAGWKPIRRNDFHWRIGLPLAALLLFTGPLFSQDYSKAFQNLRELGLPDVSSAEYGNISAPGAGSYGGWDPYASFPNLRNLQLKGNGWRLPIVDRATPVEKDVFEVVLQQASVTPFTSREPEEDSILKLGEWSPADLKADVALILKSFDDEDFSSALSGNFNISGKFLLLASHLDAKGLKKEATQLVSKTLSNSTDPEKIISSAISHVADSEYRAAMERSFASGNWQEFATACETLVTRFGAGWKFSTPVSMLAEQAAAQSTEPLTLPGSGDSPDGKIISALQAKLQSFGTDPVQDAELFSTLLTQGFLP